MKKFQILIKRYREKSGDNDNTKMFVFNNKELIPSLSVEENKFESFSEIYVVRTNTVYGSGYSMMFTDVSKNKTKEITFSKDAPS